jgi:hypothetical protein
MNGPYTLLIYEEVPENTRLFLIPNEEITDEQDKVLKACQNKFVNSDDHTDEMDTLSELIAKKKEHCRDGSKHACLWGDYEEGKEKPLKGTITRVFISGFML